MDNTGQYLNIFCKIEHHPISQYTMKPYHKSSNHSIKILLFTYFLCDSDRYPDTFRSIKIIAWGKLCQAYLKLNWVIFVLAFHILVSDFRLCSFETPRVRNFKNAANLSLAKLAAGAWVSLVSLGCFYNISTDRAQMK